MEAIDNAFYAMDEALRDPAAVSLEGRARALIMVSKARGNGEEVTLQEFDTGLPQPEYNDLEKLFPLMAKAAHLFRLYDGPAPALWADTWKQAAARCSMVCKQASIRYVQTCANEHRVIGGDIRERLDSWLYMSNLFYIWPARDGSIKAEPPSIIKAAQIQALKASTENGKGKPLYYLKTAYNKQQQGRIFTRLVEAGYIAGGAPDALQDFLNAFDPGADQQGHISWIWTDKRSKVVSARQILDFVAQMEGNDNLDGITPDLCEKAAPALFGLEISRSVLSKFRTRWNRGLYCDTHADISAMLSKK